MSVHRVAYYNVSKPNVFSRIRLRRLWSTTPNPNHQTEPDIRESTSSIAIVCVAAFMPCSLGKKNNDIMVRYFAEKIAVVIIVLWRKRLVLLI